MNTELRKIRQRHGMTQEQAARMVGVNKRTWEKYEAGDRNPSRRTVELFKLKLGEP